MALENPSLFLLVGTYEELLLCYKFCFINSTKGDLKLVFTDHSHSKSVRAVAVSYTGRFFASGGTDETLQLFSHLFSRHRQVGAVHAHEATITCLRFIGDDRLVSVDDAGSMCIWKTPSWESPVHRFPKTHKRCAPLDLSVHPSGRLALTIASGDRTMRTWDLVHLRQAACVPCAKNNFEPVSTFWSGAGQSYGVLYSRELEIYCTSSCEKVNTVSFKSSATCAVFIFGQDFVVVGFQNGQVALYELQKSGKRCFAPSLHSTVLESSTESGRVKALFSSDVTESGFGLLASACSSGWLRVFRYSRAEGIQIECVASVNIGARITSMAGTVPEAESKSSRSERGEKEKKNVNEMRSDARGSRSGVKEEKINDRKKKFQTIEDAAATERNKVKKMRKQR